MKDNKIYIKTYDLVIVMLSVVLMGFRLNAYNDIAITAVHGTEYIFRLIRPSVKYLLIVLAVRVHSYNKMHSKTGIDALLIILLILLFLL